jgi:hypothetical protein
VIGEVFGSKTLIKLPTDTKSNSLEQRATLLIFTFGDNRDDQIVVMGVPDYPPNAAEFNAGQPVVRAILGGTGKYMGACGQLTSTRNGRFLDAGVYPGEVVRNESGDAVPTNKRKCALLTRPSVGAGVESSRIGSV